MTWRLQVLYSLLAEVTYEACDDGLFAAHLERYSRFMTYVVQENLQDAPLVKPIFDGEDVSAFSIPTRRRLHEGRT